MELKKGVYDFSLPYPEVGASDEWIAAVEKEIKDSILVWGEKQTTANGILYFAKEFSIF